MAEFAQFVFSGITVGAIYALVGLGFSIIYNASRVINFAQGEFVMIGGLTTAMLVERGVPVPLAAAVAIIAAVIAGLALEKLAVEQAREAPVVTLIIITVGASIFLRGLAQVVFDRNYHALAGFSGEAPIHVGGATVVPQTLWVIGTAAALVIALWWFFGRTLLGKAILATSYDSLAAQLVGIGTRALLSLSFGLSAALGAVGGILIAPISLTSHDMGVMLGLKGFAAAVLGGLGSGLGAVAGGLLLGLVEALGAGYVSSSYKDAIAFVIILLVLFLRPTGLFGRRRTERV
ncbi:MAG TPA: branched-chain amino acid ABC transporter permease [Alphaproteobacteria bacterium]|nr:branched-chain amino acid ABC transporter permease [Alphaproteobacteria bacterium]